MCLNAKKEKMISKSIVGFEKAGARAEVFVDVVESPTSTIPFDKLIELANVEYEKIERALANNNGIPFKFHEKMFNGAYSIESSISFDTSSDWGKLLDDELVQKLIKEGLASWVFTGAGGIRFTKKLSRAKLDELNVTPAEIYNHQLHESFSTPSGVTVNKKNFLQLVLRNTHNE